MKQKTTFMKTILLAAAMMLGGSQAWAQTTLYYRTLTGTESDPADAKEQAWSATDKDGVSAESWSGDVSNVSISESGLELRVDGASTKTITKSITTTANTKLTYDFVWGYPYNNTYSQDGAYTKITIGNNIEFINEKSNGSSYVVNGIRTKYTNTLNDTKVAVHLEVNTGTLMITNLTITKVSDSSVLFNKTSIPLNEGTVFTSLSIGVKHTTNKTDGTRYTRTVFETIKLTETTQYPYSVHWKSGNTDMGEFTSGYDVNGASITIPYYRYLCKDHELYKISTGNGTDVPTVSFTKTTDNQTEYMTGYTKQDVGYVLFCEEAENIVGMSISNSQNASNRASGRYIAYCSEDVTITTLPAGTYTITAGLHGNNNNSSAPTFLIKAGETTILSVSDFASSTRSDRTSEPFTINETTDIKVNGGTYRCGFDNFYIVCTSVPATITSAGWATLYTPYPLDFSTLSANLTAYTATCTGSTVTLTQVDNVPANTGVVLKGNADTYNVPVIFSSDTDKGHMIGSATGATANDAYDGFNLYMLTKNASNEAQFKKVTSGSIAAGKAFLKINSGASALAPVMDVVFADGTTGISTMHNSQCIMHNEIYDLQGRKVSNPTKGMYIVNGRKVVIK